MNVRCTHSCRAIGHNDYSSTVHLLLLILLVSNEYPLKHGTDTIMAGGRIIFHANRDNCR